jgi:SOS response regulatory protein OraA/RecX
MGKIAIIHELSAKGVSSEEIKIAMNEYSEEIEKENLNTLCENLKNSGKTKEQAYRYIQNKGYKYETFKNQINKYFTY